MTKQLTKPKRLTAELYNEQFAAQDGVCSICKQPPTGPRNEGYKRLIPDRDEQSRLCGLLCRGCKYIIDWSGRDPDKLERMGNYLAKRNR